MALRTTVAPGGVVDAAGVGARRSDAGAALLRAARARVFRGDRLVVGNEDLLSWVLTTEGLVYVVVAGSLLVIGAVVRYAGLFRILTDDMSGEPLSVRQTLFELLPDVPALFRLCMSAVAAAVLLLIPLTAGLGAIYLFALADHDINYYLAVRLREELADLSAPERLLLSFRRILLEEGE